MTGRDRYERAIAELGLPHDWDVTVEIRPRRRTLAVEIKPGGAVAILIPPTTDPDQVVRFLRSRTEQITERVDTAVALTPDLAVKTFTTGEGYDLLGRRCALRLVDGEQAGHLPRVWVPGSGEAVLLLVRHGRPERVRRDIIALYRREGLAWAVEHGRPYEQDGQITGLHYEVRDLGRHRWGSYQGGKHTISLHWATLGLPIRLVEYVLVHEEAHATRPSGRAHGPAWQRQMYLWMPDWRRRQAELAEAGRHVWLGDWNLAE